MIRAHPTSSPRSGFAQAVLGVLRVVPDGLITLGPPCGSFVFLNRHTSKRSRERPYGDEGKEYVNLASLFESQIVLWMIAPNDSREPYASSVKFK